MESQRVGRYALVKLIGRGGMADVWIGKAFGASGFEKIVAVKLLAPYNVDKEDYQRALTDEARVLVHLKHPNIVDVYDLNFEAENPYLVMEFVEGMELRDLLRALRARQEALPRPLANYLILEVSKALSHAHGRKDPQTGRPLQIVHRDVSPSNILLSSQGDVKLSDFGIAKSTLQSGQTQVGLIKGKFRYMSPEQAEGKTLDGRADMFALGLVFYECLFGEPAYDGSSDVGIFQMARSGIVSLPESCLSEMRSILSRLLAPKPKDRFPDLSAFRRMLTEKAGALGGIGDRDALAEFMSHLNLPQLQKAIEIRRQAEDWDPQPTSRILTTVGTIQTLAEENHKPHRRWPYALGAVTLAGALFLGATLWLHLEDGRSIAKEVPLSGTTMETNPLVAAQASVTKIAKADGKLTVTTVPRDTLVRVSYGDKKWEQFPPVSLSGIPFGVPVTVTATKKGFKTVSRQIRLSDARPEEKQALILEKSKNLRVRFVADPYAAVTISGFLSGIETPIANRTLPPGDYNVIFVHSASGHRTVARLHGQEGGSFLCSARMAVQHPGGRATSHCRAR